jgi:hypothetical protein
MDDLSQGQAEHFLGQSLRDIALAEGNILRWQCEDMYASRKGAQTLSIYQEARIRHLHAAPDKYLEKMK